MNKLDFENSLLVDFDGECLDSGINQLVTQSVLVLGSQSGVAQGVGNCDGGDDTVCANRQGDRSNGAHVHDRNADTLDFLNHRCAATSAGASCRGHDNGVNSSLQQLLSVLSSELLGRSNSGTVTNGGVEVAMQLANLAFALHLTQNVDGQNAVGLIVSVDGVVAAVCGFPSISGQGVDALDVVLTVVRSGGSLDAVGVALGNGTTGGTQCQGSLGHVSDCLAGLDAVEVGHGELSG